MKETRLSEIVCQKTYEALMDKYKQLVKDKDIDRILTLRICTYACIHQEAVKAGHSPWRTPNDFLYSLATVPHFFEMYHDALHKALKDKTRFHLFGNNTANIKTKLI